MKLSLTGIKNPSIWARTHFGSSDHAFRLAVENIVASAAKPNKFVDIAIAGTGTRAERLSGWIIPVAKERGVHHVFIASRLMRFKLASEDDGRTFVLILDQGEEAFAAITAFANEKAINAASVAAIGAFESAKVGWFDLAAKRYSPISVDEQCEVLSLVGDIAQGDDGKASLHLHAVLGLRDGSVRGGHLLDGKVRPTLEVTIVETASNLRRKKRADLGIALIDI
jgi:predicted DNA-binding protein with PD1-like motif